jgi:uncharacterized protein DUF87
MEINVRELGQEYVHLLQPLGLDREPQPMLAGPDTFFQTLLDYALERSYLEGLSAVSQFPKPNATPREVTWVRLARLPVHPTHAEDYDLLSRWQGVLSTLHAWRHRLVFLLLRHAGQTHLYLGAVSSTGAVDATAAAAQMCQATTSQMPGIDLHPIGRDAALRDIVIPYMRLEAAGAVTGLPSPRQGPNYRVLQTLDQVAFGLRDFSQDEYNYAVVVIADPVPDSQIAEVIRVLRLLGSHIHGAVKRTESETGSTQKTIQGGLTWGVLAGVLLAFVPGVPQLLPGAIGHAGLSVSRSKTQTHGMSVSRESLDKTAQYCEQVTDKHVERLKQGRNLGFWNTGIYVLAETDTAVTTLTGMLRAVYSGEESYLEPIRVHQFSRSSGAADCIKQFQHIAYPEDPDRTRVSRELTGRVAGWHPLGGIFESVTTPLNTQELSLATSLPRRDVPGLRFVRHAVRFAANPPLLSASATTITLGHIMDTGVALGMPYTFDLHTMVRHALVTGTTGFGKSTTCRRLFLEVMQRAIPVLVVEPAKDEYVRWALEYNRGVPEAQRLRIYMPGVEDLDGTPLSALRLNPFEPASAGPTMDFAARYERLSAVLAASLPMADVLPLLLEEAIYLYMQHAIDVRFADGELPPRESYPRLQGLLATARRVIEGRGYEARVQDNLKAAIETRVGALTRGKRGQILNVSKSTPFVDLFDRPAVVNLSQITDNRDKSLIMALLLMALCEYRLSRYRTDEAYRERASANKLCHLAIIEEAHRLLAHPAKDYAGTGNPQAVVAGMFSEMLAEIRAYGQGLLIVDQVPGDLIPNAIKNTSCKIVHRLGASDDRAAMAACMALRPDQAEIIATLPVGEAIVYSDHDDAATWLKISQA